LLDKSLEDLVEKKSKTKNPNKPRGGGQQGGRSNARGNGPRTGGPVRGQFQQNKTGGRQQQIFQKPGTQNRNRGGGRQGQNRADLNQQWTHNAYQDQDEGQSNTSSRQNSSDYGTKVRVTNLRFDVLEDELQELFCSVGKVHSVRVQYDKTGRSSGTADVIFKKHADALRAIREYDGRKIDDQAMSLSEVGQVNIGEKKMQQARERKENRTSFGGQSNNNNNSNNNSNNSNNRSESNSSFRQNNNRRNNSADDMDEDSNFKITVQY